MKKLSLVKILYACVLLLTCEAASAQAVKTHEEISRKQKTTIDSLFHSLDKNDHPGAAVAIVKNGKILFEKGYGYANLQYDIPISPSTVFHIASLSKQFTALSVLLLVNEGKLALNDDIHKYLPEMHVFEKPVTILNLLNHTGGLREWIYLLGLQGYRLNDMFTQEQILKVLSAQTDLNFEPGTKFMYVNSGYNLLAEIVARVSGMPFAQFVKQRIFIPLNMTHSLVSDNNETIVKNAADSYAPDGKNGYVRKPLNYVNVTGSTGVLTTVGDLSLWAANFETAKVGGAKLLNQMKQRGILNNGDTIDYAMGQFAGHYRGLNTIDHSGSDAGFRAHLLRFPQKHVAIIVLGNDASLNAGDLAFKIADIYLKKELKSNSAAPAKPAAMPSPAFVKTNAGALADYTGKFELRPGMIMDFVIENGSLTVNATGQGKFILQQTAPDVFKITGVNGIITFQKNEKGDAEKLRFDINGSAMQGARIKKAPISAESIAPFSGQFYSRELDAAYSLHYDNGKFLATNNRSGDIELSLIGDDTFSGNQWFMGIVKFVRNDKHVITGFAVSSDRVVNLIFEKR